MRASGCWGWRRGQDSQARILTSGRLQRRVQAAKTGRTRNTALFPGHTHTRVTYTGLGFWRMNEASRFLQLLWVPAPSPQSPLLRRHLPRAYRRTLQFAAARLLHCLPTVGLLSSRPLSSRLKRHYRCLSRNFPTLPKQAPERGQAGGISKQVLWFVTVSREKTKNSKRWRKESDVLNRPVGDTTQQKLMMIYDSQVYNITIQYLSKLQNDYYKGTYHLSPYTVVFSWDEELLRSTLLVTFKYVIQCY